MVLSRMRLSVIGAVCAAALVTAACGSTPDPAGNPASCQGRARQLTIATGTANGVYAALGSALATQLANTTPLTAKAIETGSTLRNVQQLATGEYDIAFAQADGATDAVRGQGVFAEPQKIQALARIYSDYAQVVVRADSGIASMADFRGKRISTGPAQSGTELIADRLLTAAGLDPAKDVQGQALDLGTSVSALESGKLDGFVWSGGLPTGGIQSLVAAQGSAVRFLDVSALLPALQKDDAAYAAGTIPAAVYGTPADVPTISLPNLLVVRSDFDEADACAITTALFKSKAQLAAVVPAAAGLDVRVAADTGPVPLNAGAKAALAALTP